jgi:lipopolysaccharide transport system ATP-binding protein
MSDPIIRVENLSKKYIIDHQQVDRNLTLRDAIAKRTRSLTTKLNPLAQTSNLKLQNSSKEDFWALKDVSFEIQQGDRVGIIGRNGAGKSTLLKVLSRITEPTSGSIRIKGRVASLLEVGTGFHPELTGRENVYLNGAILGMSKAEIERKFDEIVAFAEVEKFLDTPVKRYSSGMYVRLAFAVAAHLEPEILIVDEVLAVGDSAFQKKCLGKMGEVAQEGRTVIFVSHSMGAVSTLCDKAVFLEKGNVRAIGTTDEIITIYSSELFNNKIDNLSDLRLPGLGKEIRFSDIQIFSNSGSNINFGESIAYVLTIESEVNMDELIIGASIFNASGNCIGSLLSNDTFSIKSGKESRVYLKIHNTNLAPGSYYAGFGLGQKGTQKNFDAVIGKPAFQILPISAEKEFSIKNWQSSWGNICFNQSELVIEGEADEIFFK